MTLTDGDVAALARQAAALVGPDVVATVSATARTDGLSGRAWEVDLLGLVALEVLEDTPGAEVLARLVDQVTEYGTEQPRLWGQAFPPCPGHRHPAGVDVAGSDVVMRCPATGAEVGRVTPVVS